MKQETLEEEFWNLFNKTNNKYCPVSKEQFLRVVKWQAERSYSAEEMIAFGEFIFKHTLLAHSKGVKNLLEQFKKK